MTGDERVRFCAECSLNVYNVSAMSRAEASAFVASAEGRVCVKFYRRADGTLLTRDCPVGLKITRRRKAKVATAAFAAVMSVAASALAQDSTQTGSAKGSQQAAAASTQTQQENQKGLAGKIVDVRGVAVAGVKVGVYNERTPRTETAVTSETGEFKFPALEAGQYTLIVRAAGFNAFELNGIEVFSDKPANVNVTLQPEGVTVMVGVLVWEPSEVTITQGTTTIRLPN